MVDSTWELFFRTGLPQAYNFAKARDAKQNCSVRPKRQNRDRQETVQ